MSWTVIGRYRTGTADGNTEDFVLEKDDQGNFRIKNDFGNIVIDFERMAGYEFFRKVKRDIENDIEDELNDLWAGADFDDNDDNKDCDDSDTSDPYGFHSIDSDSFGAD
jgi:hypothetical protein